MSKRFESTIQDQQKIIDEQKDKIQKLTEDDVAPIEKEKADELLTRTKRMYEEKINNLKALQMEKIKTFEKLLSEANIKRESQFRNYKEMQTNYYWRRWLICTTF